MSHILYVLQSFVLVTSLGSTMTPQPYVSKMVI